MCKINQTTAFMTRYKLSHQKITEYLFDLSKANQSDNCLYESRHIATSKKSPRFDSNQLNQMEWNLCSFVN